MKKLPLIFVAQAISAVLLMLSVSSAYREADAFISTNAFSPAGQEFHTDDLKFADSTFSKHLLLKSCFDNMNSMFALLSAKQDNLERAEVCAARARDILLRDPAMALAWVVIADRHFWAGELKKATQAIEMSHEIAPNESWLAKSRLAILLKHSNHVDFDNDNTFVSDAVLLLNRGENARWVAAKWKSVEEARPAIELALSMAPEHMQRLFMRTIRKIT